MSQCIANKTYCDAFREIIGQLFDAAGATWLRRLLGALIERDGLSNSRKLFRPAETTPEETA